ncbi:hypothetical protein O0I10_004152 [Lichtheimia ornata]|uniref:Inner centromere protein ARK-binding domain-containing protein n=1 Tax=Lichtheimia ornata TaxID=688661 RepID=A0AAD7XZL0_9FUNG|nr:uncharacterized protein O0I10_004152 [Lichtheimia ornata]KAJ8660290.1 hypothetical protein O0I10_004152 [Lichtheimia ornata]
MADKELVAKGENWARAQRERLEQAANEKATQLRRIYNEHLEWFKTHTIESLIETRRPAKRHKANDNADLTSTDQVKLVQSSRHTIVDESSMEGNSMRSFSRQSLTSRSFHSPTSYRSFSLTSPTANQSSTTGTSSRQRKSLRSPTRIHHDASRASRSHSVDTNPKKQPRSSSISNKGKQDTQRRSISKETQVEATTTNESSLATTNESSAAPATTTNESTLATTKEASAAAAENESSMATATTNEPSLATKTNESSSSSLAAATTAANEPSSSTGTKTTTSKKLSTTSTDKKTTTSNKATRKEPSNADNTEMPSQQNEQSSDKTGAENNEASSSHVDPDFQLNETPAWAEMPELERHLRQQCNMDGHKIFGRMTPLVTSEVFGTLRQRQARK